MWLERGSLAGNLCGKLNPRVVERIGFERDKEEARALN
jgi:hypothetical protein